MVQWVKPRAFTVRPWLALVALVALIVAGAALLIPRASPERPTYQRSLRTSVVHSTGPAPLCDAMDAGTELPAPLLGFLEAWERGDRAARDRWLVAGADSLPGGRADGCVSFNYHYRGNFSLAVSSANRVGDPWDAYVVVRPVGDRLALVRASVERWQPTIAIDSAHCSPPADTIARMPLFAVVARRPWPERR